MVISDIGMTIEAAHIRPARRGFLKGVGADNSARSCFRPSWLSRSNNAARRCSPRPRASRGRQLTASRFGISRSPLTVYQPSGGSLVSRVNHPIQPRDGVSLSLAAIAPGTAAATTHTAPSAVGPPTRRYRSCTSHRTMASTGATRGSRPRAASGSQCRPPAMASQPSTFAAITSPPPHDRRAR